MPPRGFYDEDDELPRFSALTADRGWMVDAECRKIDLPIAERVAMFFPKRGHKWHKAIAVCNVCPVKKECAEYAQATATMYGVWAGRMLRRYDKERTFPE